MNACLPRGKATLDATLDGLDVEHHWLPGNGLTHCNQAAESALETLGAPIPPGMLANAQGEWFASQEAGQLGWGLCLPDVAASQAELGCPAVVCLHELPHGHIAIVRGFDEHGNVLVWQAGRTNHNRATLRQCFTQEQLARVKFFTCN